MKANGFVRFAALLLLGLVVVMVLVVCPPESFYYAFMEACNDLAEFIN